MSYLRTVWSIVPLSLTLAFIAIGTFTLIAQSGISGAVPTRMTLQVNGAPPADTNVVRRVIRGGERLSFVLRSNTRYQFTASHTGTYRIRVLSVSRLNGGRLVVRGAESVSFVRQPQLLSGSRDILFVGGRISSAGNLASVDNALQVDLLVVGPGQTELPVAAVFSIEPPD